MEDIILFIISISFVAILGYLSYRAIKKTNSLAEKISEIVMYLVMVVILVIYYLDRYDIPSKFNLTMNINTQNWLSLIGNYITGIISAIIGALVAVWTTIYQIRKNNEQNEKRDKENLRIQNMPILKYDINTERKGTGDLSEIIITNKENEQQNVYNLNIILKNIGLNSIKDAIVDFNSDIINKATYRLSGNGRINPMEKGEVIEINRFFSIKTSEKDYEMYLTVYYQDVLANWYRQKIIIYYNASNIFNQGGYIGQVRCEVKKEEIIDKDDIEKKVI